MKREESEGGTHTGPYPLERQLIFFWQLAAIQILQYYILPCTWMRKFIPVEVRTFQTMASDSIHRLNGA